MEKSIVTFGEIMLRLSPPGFLRFSQATSFDVQYGGGEANVCASLAQFGDPVEFVTRLPANDIGEACLQALLKLGIGTDNIVRGGDRLGIYFLEMGSALRGSRVVYDRSSSSFASIQSGMIDWDAIFINASWFHWTGITPAVSFTTATVLGEALKSAKAHGVTISCDLNYRARLWNWGKKASEVMPDLVRYCDCAIGNEEDAEKIFGIKAAETDILKGKLSGEQFRGVCIQLAEKFPNLKQIAITLRGSLSASHNTWSAVLWNHGDFIQGMKVDIEPIVDRVGGGDSFAAGLIYGLRHKPNPCDALNFAISASALKHTVFGDFNIISLEEAERLAVGDASGRVIR
jgi:2-dehydro-3-deoxygluconokinase